MRRTFNVRFSDEELRTLKLRAQARGWSLGRYIRWRALGHDLELEDRVKELERKAKREAP